MAQDLRDATPEDVDRALDTAASAFETLRRKPGRELAALLEAAAVELRGLAQQLIALAHAESHLPIDRLEAEHTRMLHQCAVFADMARQGTHLDARIDRAQQPDGGNRQPDLRAMNIGVGPVVVFGASNFPFAISVVGTDTVAALAAGCPVVAKGHPAQPRTSALLASAFTASADKTGMPAGTFTMLHGAGYDIGLRMVTHPATRAVAFTGSLRGGRALFDAAAARPVPIPVYAEMGSVNPVIILPGAAAARAEQIAAAYVQAMTTGVGQYCTNPGIVLGIEGAPLARFVAAAGAATSAVAPAPMLTSGIAAAFDAGTARLQNTPGLRVVGQSQPAANTAAGQGAATLFEAAPGLLDTYPYLGEEVFGPTSIVLRCRDEAEVERAIRRLGGHLVACVFATDDDLARHRDLLSLLETKVGRIVWNGFGPGLRVCASMHHGGPYPATTDPHFTSVGHQAIARFVRPICFQEFPDAALPEALRGRNTLGLLRLVDGKPTRDDV